MSESKGPSRRRKEDVSPAELAEMKRLKTEEGLTQAQIGGRFKLSPFSVRSLLKGVPSKAEADRQSELQQQQDAFRSQLSEISEDEPVSEDLARFALKPGRERHE